MTEEKLYPALFSVGKFTIYTHGVLIALGILLGGLLTFFLIRKKKNTQLLLDLIIYSTLAGIIGARLLYILIYSREFQGISDMFAIWNGGLVSFGGMLGGYIASWYYLKQKKENFLSWFDLSAPGFFLGWAVGRIGCLLAGDSYGYFSKGAISIWGRIPVQLFETIASILIAGILLWLIKQKKIIFPNGFIFGIGIGLYGLSRFIIDFYRDEGTVFSIFKLSQIFGLALFLLSVAALVVWLKKERKFQWPF